MENLTNDTGALEWIDISKHHPKKVPSLAWRNCIKKIYEIDPLACPNCGSEMRIIAFITEFLVVKRILDHLGLWKTDHPRGPPPKDETRYEPFDDGWFRGVIDEATTIIGF